MICRTIDTIAVGDTESFEKTVTETDVYMYAGLTGDINPAHINEKYMKTQIFKGRIVHGMLTAGLVSAVLGNKLPGPGTIYLGQELKFKAPVKFNDTIKATVTVIEKIEEKNRLILETICTNQDGVVVLSGKATVMPPKAQ
jgi:3-hydroxybutyryl-CoA dehydratase